MSVRDCVRARAVTAMALRPTCSGIVNNRKHTHTCCMKYISKNVFRLGVGIPSGRSSVRQSRQSRPGAKLEPSEPSGCKITAYFPVRCVSQCTSTLQCFLLSLFTDAGDIFRPDIELPCAIRPALIHTVFLHPSISSRYTINIRTILGSLRRKKVFCYGGPPL